MVTQYKIVQEDDRKLVTQYEIIQGDDKIFGDPI